MATERFEKAFIQCLKDGIYPGPSNINERFRADHKRINRLNGQYSRMRLELMYLFAVPYQRGSIREWIPASPGSYVQKPLYNLGVPEWPYLNEFELVDGTMVDYQPPQMGSRKHEILKDTSQPWELKRK